MNDPRLTDFPSQKGSVALHTLGCKLNFSETSFIGKQFKEKGYQIVPFDSAADVYVLNTCTVTENAEKECRQIVRRILRHNPDGYVIVTGCYAQLRPEEITAIEGVDAVLGTQEKFKLFSYIDDFTKRSFPCTFVSDKDQLSSEFGFSSSDPDDRTRAYYKIQDGCDYKCTFCTIPRARGNSRSLDSLQALNGFTSLVNNGFKEIILTGVNVGDYLDQSEQSLAHLLKLFLTVKADFRLRISSIEPNLLSDQIIDLVASDRRLCPHFHIPLQSGSSEILRLMKRRYTAEFYCKLIEKLNTQIPGVGIGIDVITGFPGETEALFEETRKFLADLKFSYLHAFTYSARPDTPALSYDNHIETVHKRERTNILRALGERKRRAFYESTVGTTAEVIFETGEIQGMMRGFTSQYVRVAAPFDAHLTNKIIPVVIEKAEDNVCLAKLL